MPSHVQAESYLITDPKTAKILLKRDIRKFMMPFMSSASSINQAAGKLGFDARKTRNLVYRLMKLGILVESSGKKHTKTYRATAKNFKIPFGTSPFNSLTELMVYVSNWEIICHYHETILLQTFKGSWFLRLYPIAGEEFLAAQIGNEQPPIQKEARAAYHGSGNYLQLTHQQAKNLKEDLSQLLGNYEMLSNRTENQESKQTYFLHLHLVPKPSP